MTVRDKPARVFRRSAVGQAELAALLAGMVPANTRAWCMAGRPDKAHFDRFDPAQAEAVLTNWPEGRGFSAGFELRWRHRDDSFDVLLLVDEASIAQPNGFSQLGEGWQAVAPGTHACFQAWGSAPSADQSSVRMESRLPMLPAYPPDCLAGRLRCLYYVDSSGATRLVRLCGVV
jgi:hypothetical protein